MTLRSTFVAGLLIASIGATGWLYIENRSLRAQLSERTGAAASAANPTAMPATAKAASIPSEGQGEGKSSKTTASTSKQWRFDTRDTERPGLSTKENRAETRAERRQRIQSRIVDMFGRTPDETAEAYRERIAPFVELMLSGPRSRVNDLRHEAEQAAGVTNEQRTQLDTVFEDSFAEALALTNRALESGDLTPYSRNWVGVMNVAGGLGAVLGGAQSRIDGILSPEQRQIIYDQGFEWGEYLGVSVPWEQLNAPPPPPNAQAD